MTKTESSLSTVASPKMVLVGATDRYSRRAQPGTGQLSLTNPNDYPNAVFVEQSPRHFQSFWTVFMLATSLAAVLGAALPAITLMDLSALTIDDLIFASLLGLMCGAFAALVVGVFGVAIYRTAPWPIVLQERGGVLIARLAQRKHWAPVDTLSPKLSSGPLEFRRPSKAQTGGSPFKRHKLPDSLKNQQFGTWLVLRWKHRIRWVLLCMHETEEASLVAQTEWAGRLGLDAASSLDTEPAPSSIVLQGWPRLW